MTALATKLKTNERQLQQAAATLADASKKAAEAASSAAAQHEAALAALRGEAEAATVEAAEAHNGAVSAALAERDAALKSAADVQRDASANMQRLQEERDEVLQKVTELHDKVRTLAAAAERVPGLELQAADLDAKQVCALSTPSRHPCRIAVSSSLLLVLTCWLRRRTLPCCWRTWRRS